MLRSTTQVARLSPSSSAEPPVYVEGDADIVEVQRLMARNHIRSLPVAHGVVVVGIIDLLDDGRGPVRHQPDRAGHSRITHPPLTPQQQIASSLGNSPRTGRHDTRPSLPPPSTYPSATNNVVVRQLTKNPAAPEPATNPTRQRSRLRWPTRRRTCAANSSLLRLSCPEVTVSMRQSKLTTLE